MFDEPDASGSFTEDGNSHYALSQTHLALLVCPDDDTIVMGRGNLSYVVNGGTTRFWWFPRNNHMVFGDAARLRLAEASPDADQKPPYGSANGFFVNVFDGRDEQVGNHMGLMFIGSPRGNTPYDVRRTFASIQDGTSQTIMLGENIHAGYSHHLPTAAHAIAHGRPHDAPHLWYDKTHSGSPGYGFAEGSWANPDPAHCTFRMSDDFCSADGNCQSGATVRFFDQRQQKAIQISRVDYRMANHRHARDNLLGWSESINGEPSADEGHPYLSSGHPGGVNIVMCDGSVRFLNDDVDGSVFYRLVTPAGSSRGLREIWPVYETPGDDF